MDTDNTLTEDNERMRKLLPNNVEQSSETFTELVRVGVGVGDFHGTGNGR